MSKADPRATFRPTSSESHKPLKTAQLVAIAKVFRSFAHERTRSLLLAASNSRRAERWVTRYGMRLGASRFVTGEDIDDCIRVIKELNGQGLKANAAILGEAVTDRDDALRARSEYELLVGRLRGEGLNASVALKLTLLGLRMDETFAQENLGYLLRRAELHNLSVGIDMEESKYVDSTLRIYRRMRELGHTNIGVALQAYLYRSLEDLESLLPLRPNVRIVKGAYLESAKVAFPVKADVDRNYLRMVELSLSGDGYTAIATHDESIIKAVISFVHEHGIGRDRFEFQLLYGIRPSLQQSLAQAGYTVLVATTFGTHWYPFFMRRLAERPANLLFLLRSLAKS